MGQSRYLPGAMGAIGSTKSLVLKHLLDAEDFVLIVVDPRVGGVKLPENLLKAGQPVGINIGWRMAIPVPDLRIDDDGIVGTLSFKRSPFLCAFPWPSVIQVTAGDEHIVWVVKAPPEKQKDSGSPAAKKKPTHLRLVD